MLYLGTVIRLENALINYSIDHRGIRVEPNEQISIFILVFPLSFVIADFDFEGILGGIWVEQLVGTHSAIF